RAPEPFNAVIGPLDLQPLPAEVVGEHFGHGLVVFDDQDLRQPGTSRFHPCFTVIPPQSDGSRSPRALPRRSSSPRVHSQSSGAGITQITAKTVDFGASDAPLKDSEAAAAPGLLEIPTVLGAVVLAYNVPGVPTGLKLTPEAISGIFLNKIQFWDDAAIKADNAGVTLPHKQIVSVHRKDSSGTTFVFTSYLSKVSTQWANDPKLGAAKSVTWPSGLQGDGNAGVAQKIGSVQYSIGYIELAYALSNTITYASVKGPGGDFVVPSIDSVTAAGSGLTFPIGPKTN